MKLFKLKKLTKSILTGSLILSSLHSYAGSAAGNGDYCQQKENICERMRFAITAKHLNVHDELVQKIKNADLPRNLKYNLLADLDDVQIIESDEKITPEDLQERYEMQITEETTTKNYDEEDNYKGKSVVTKKTRTKILPDLGIFINHGHGYKLNDGEKTYVRAVTQQGNPNLVIYFMPMIENIPNTEEGKHELIRLVLHEQAHRLPLLGPIKDERKAEGWAHALHRYLYGQISKREFYKIARSFGVNTKRRIRIPNSKRTTGNNFKAEITIVLNRENLLDGGYDGNSFLIELDPNTFSNYPSLTEANWNRIIVNPYHSVSLSGPDSNSSDWNRVVADLIRTNEKSFMDPYSYYQPVDLIITHFDDLLNFNASLPVKLKLSVFFQEERLDTNSNNISFTTKIQNVRPSISQVQELAIETEGTLKTIFKGLGFGKNLSIGSPNIEYIKKSYSNSLAAQLFFKSELENDYRKIIETSQVIKGELENINIENPDFFKFLRGNIQLDFSILTDEESKLESTKEQLSNQKYHFQVSVSRDSSLVEVRKLIHDELNNLKEELEESFLDARIENKLNHENIHWKNKASKTDKYVLGKIIENEVLTNRLQCVAKKLMDHDSDIQLVFKSISKYNFSYININKEGNLEFRYSISDLSSTESMNELANYFLEILSSPVALWDNKSKYYKWVGLKNITHRTHAQYGLKYVKVFRWHETKKEAILEKWGLDMVIDKPKMHLINRVLIDCDK